MTQLFISDLHLDVSRPEATEAFKGLLAGEARNAERLYILGDLFEAWIGDDDPSPLNKEIAKALRELHEAGTSVYFIHGNRDFLLKRNFATEARMHLLPEIAIASLGGQRALLLHGDLLCTDDERYMRMRRWFNNRALQGLFLSLPLSMRQSIADSMRAKSMAENAQKDEYIMDASQATVERMLNSYDATLMIHGHTHRPAVHDFDLNGKAAKRIVLGDWYDQGSVLRWTDTGSDAGFELTALAYA